MYEVFSSNPLFVSSDHARIEFHASKPEQTRANLLSMLSYNTNTSTLNRVPVEHGHVDDDCSEFLIQESISSSFICIPPGKSYYMYATHGALWRGPPRPHERTRNLNATHMKDLMGRKGSENVPSSENYKQTTETTARKFNEHDLKGRVRGERGRGRDCHRS